MTHHAYYIEGPLSQFEGYKESLKPFWARQYERFGVDESRELIALTSLKNFADATFFVGASSITTEAQQALLKLLEEPQEGTTFIFLVPHGVLLPTVLSRMMQMEKVSTAHKKVLGSPVSAKTHEAGRPDYFSELSTLFLRVGGKERSDMIAKLLKDDEGTKERVRDFVNALEVTLAEQKSSPQQRQGLADLAMVRGYLADRSPSLKMLLEHLALCLPVL
ncbi:hypothetical protein EXS62_01590 [Candidatus Kaiserbacteria bacterium]|nr:hypothetical protein [Candidatus Kaiserbacteria bacterium]